MTQAEAPTPCAIDVFQPSLNRRHSLEAAASLASVPRRSILIYYRAGLVRPELETPYEIMMFSEEDIYTIRRIEQLRTENAIGVALIKTLFDLRDEVEVLRRELRFLRNH